MKKIGIIAAMNSEINMIKSILNDVKEEKREEIDFITGQLGDKEIILMESGIGKVCAAVKTAELIREFAPDCMINSGVAGGIGDQVSKMDIVASTETVYSDVWCLKPNLYGQVQGFPPRFASDKRLLELIAEGENEGIAVHKGLICSGDKFVSGVDEALEIRRKFSDGLAVDMESCAAAQVCYMKKVPFVSLRIISDNPLRNNDNFQEYADFWGEMAQRSFKILKKLLNAL